VIDNKPYKYNLETKRWDLESTAGANIIASPNEQNAQSNTPATTGASSGANENEARKKAIQLAAANTAKSILNALEGFAASME
jgi:hypothetical protein